MRASPMHPVYHTGKVGPAGCQAGVGLGMEPDGAGLAGYGRDTRRFGRIIAVLT